MKVSEVSKRYARALYEVANANQKSELVFSELRVLHQAMSLDTNLSDFFSSPVVLPNQKIAALNGSLSTKFSTEIQNTLILMAEKNRLNLFSELVSAYEQISDENHGVSRGWVRSAKPISTESRARMEETVNKVTGKKVILSFTEDPTVLGGMVAQVGGWTFDDSIDSHLKRLNEELNRRAN